MVVWFRRVGHLLIWALLAGVIAVPLLGWLIVGFHGLGANYLPSLAYECATVTDQPFVGTRNYIMVSPWAVECFEASGALAFRNWGVLLVVFFVFVPPSLAVGLILFLALRNRRRRRQVPSETTGSVGMAVVSLGGGVLAVGALVVVYFLSFMVEDLASPWGDVLFLSAVTVGFIAWALIVRGALRRPRHVESSAMTPTNWEPPEWRR
jgi:hypothetical protein